MAEKARLKIGHACACRNVHHQRIGDFLKAIVDTMLARFKHACVQKNALQRQLYAVKCGNGLRFGERAQNVSALLS